VLTRRPLEDHLPLALLLALALVYKALVPAGWMPVVENGSVALKLCGAWSQQLPVVAEPLQHDAHRGQHAAPPPVQHQDHEQDQQGADQPCSFAAGGLSWTGPQDPAQSIAQLSPAQPPTILHRRRVVQAGLASPPPPATGPPLFA